MHFRLTLAGISVMMLLSGCAHNPAADNVSENFSGPTQVHIFHLLTRADDGSRIFLTIDGKEAGLLPAGESRDIDLKAGKHQIGGYVSTLFNYGRVTVKPVDVITNAHAVQNVTYAVTNNQFGFRLTGSTPIIQPAPGTKPVQTKAVDETHSSAETTNSNFGVSVKSDMTDGKNGITPRMTPTHPSLEVTTASGATARLRAAEI